MNRFKEFCTDYPTLGGAAVIGGFLLLITGVNVNVMLARGKPFPDGYEPWLWFLGATATGTLAGMLGKRATDHELARIKAGGPSPVTAEAGSTVKVMPNLPAPVEPSPGVETRSDGATIITGI